MWYAKRIVTAEKRMDGESRVQIEVLNSLPLSSRWISGNSQLRSALMLGGRGVVRHGRHQDIMRWEVATLRSEAGKQRIGTKVL
jgi:hypothetical protein